MGIVLNSSIVVEVGAIKYMMSRQVCQRTDTLIIEEYSNSSTMHYICGLK